jgi:hypothetical protein
MGIDPNTLFDQVALTLALRGHRALTEAGSFVFEYDRDQLMAVPVGVLLHVLMASFKTYYEFVAPMASRASTLLTVMAVHSSLNKDYKYLNIPRRYRFDFAHFIPGLDSKIKDVLESVPHDDVEYNPGLEVVHYDHDYGYEQIDVEILCFLRTTGLELHHLNRLRTRVFAVEGMLEVKHIMPPTILDPIIEYEPWVYLGSAKLINNYQGHVTQSYDIGRIGVYHGTNTFQNVNKMADDYLHNWMTKRGRKRSYFSSRIDIRRVGKLRPCQFGRLLSADYNLSIRV